MQNSRDGNEPAASPNKDDDLAREIETHLELEAEERVADGASEDEARDAARRAFGNVLRVREDARAVWTAPWLDHLHQDLRYAARSLRKTPGFTAAAILTVALGIGANTAIFTVVNSILLRPLPFPESGRVVRLFEHVAAPGPAGAPPRRVPALTLSELDTFASQTKTLSHVGAQIPTIRTLTGRQEPVRIVGARVSPSTFSMMRGSLHLGRVFDSGENSPGADAVVILSYATWQRRFNADPGVVGEPLEMNGRVHTVIGVMNPGFRFTDPQDEFWMPLTTAGPMMQQRLPVAARLNDGVMPEVALDEVQAIVPRLRGEARSATPSQDSGGNRFEVVRLMDLVVAPVRTPLLVLMAAVGSVLLLACVNVANLLLARTATRKREMAVRFALGAGRGRLIRQALTESLLLSMLGGVAGVALAVGGVRLLRTLAASLPRRDLGPGVGVPRLDEISVDASVLVFTLAAAALTGVLFGILPALRHSGVQLTSALRQGTSSSAGFNLLRGNRLQGVLVVSEIAMAMTLLIGGGLLVRSFVNMSRQNPGYDPDGVVTFQLSLPPGRPDAQLRGVAEDLVERLEARPGVQAAGYAEALPMTRVAARFVPLGTRPLAQPLRRPAGGPITPDNPFARFVSRDFLAALSIPLIAGRTFSDADRAGQPQVMLINRTLARSGFLGDNPLGRQVYALGTKPWEVVGIVEDVRQSSLTETVAPQVFIDYRQVPEDEPLAGVGLYFGVRIAGDPAPVVSNLRGIVAGLDSQAMIESVAPMRQLVSISLARPRLYAVLLGIFAVVAVILAVTGIYGVMAYSVAQRTREIGVRMALGAGRLRILKLVLGESGMVSVVGIALGLAGAAAVTRYLEGLLFGLTALDPGTFVSVALVLAAVATFAAFVAAWRATRVDPLIALRFE